MPAQTKRKRRHFYRINSRGLLLGFLIFAVVLLTAGGLFRILAAWNNRVWRGGERVTFVVATSPPLLVSYQSQPGEIIVIQFSKNLEISGGFGVGKWKLESLYELGNQRNLGGKLLVSSLQYNLGVPIDGWVSEESLLSGERGKFSILTSDTNFSFFDRVRLLVELGGVPARERRILSAEKIGLVKPARMGDGSLGFILDKERVKEVILREFQDILVAKERVGVGIVNGTDTQGAGEQIAKVVGGLGAQVLWVRTQKFDISRCEIRTSQPRSKTMERLRDLFSCKVYWGRDGLSAPVELVIGEQLALEIPPIK